MRGGLAETLKEHVITSAQGSHSELFCIDHGTTLLTSCRGFDGKPKQGTPRI